MIRYTCTGVDGSGCEFEIAGLADYEHVLEIELLELRHTVLLALTHGVSATTGAQGERPGRGPYTLTRLTIERVPQ